MGCCATKNKIGLIPESNPTSDGTIATETKLRSLKRKVQINMSKVVSIKSARASDEARMQNKSVTMKKTRSRDKETDTQVMDKAPLFEATNKMENKISQHSSTEVFQIVKTVEQIPIEKTEIALTTKDDLVFEDLDLEVDFHDNASESVKYEIDGTKLAESYDNVFGDDVSKEGHFGNIDGSPELGRRKNDVIPSGRVERSQHQREHVVEKERRIRLRGTSDIQHQGQSLELRKKEEKCDFEVKEYDEISDDDMYLTSGDSCNLMLISENEDSDTLSRDVTQPNVVEIQSIDNYYVQSFIYDQFHYGKHEEELKEVEKSKSRSRRLSDLQSEGNDPCSEALLAMTSAAGRLSHPQIIQVTPVEKSKEEYSYQYANDCSHLERLERKRNNNLTDGRPLSSKQDITPYQGRRRGLIQVVPKENTNSYSYKPTSSSLHKNIVPTADNGKRGHSVGVVPIKGTRKENDSDFTDLTMREVNDYIIRDMSISYLGQSMDDTDGTFNNNSTSERNRKIRAKRSYLTRNKNNCQLQPVSPNTSDVIEHPNITEIHDGMCSDVTANNTSSRESEVLGPETSSSLTSYTLADIQNYRSRQKIRRDSMILGANMGSSDYIRGMGSSPLHSAISERATLSQWSRHLPS